MAYAYWKLNKHEEPAVFDLYFRKCPFGGEFAVFAGLQAAVEFLSSYKFSQDEIAYLRHSLPHADPGFFSWLDSVDCSGIKVFALREGSVCFPQVPLLRVEGPLAICQLLETTLLNLINYSSLVCTNAARYRLAAGATKRMLEFGLRRAQGPDGAMTASRYCYMGGFDATSNVKAGQMFDIAIAGTHAHAFVCSFSGLDDLKSHVIKHAETGDLVDLVALARSYREKLHLSATPNDGEFAAFLGYAICFPDAFLALVDTYNTLKSGVPNFLAVALALRDCGYAAKGVRLDSGDIAYLSKETRKLFCAAAEQFSEPSFHNLAIAASNEISEATLLSLNQQGHEVTTFGIGTHLVTCAGQTALGCVYKLVELNGIPRLKLSQDLSKVTIPGRKEAFRLLDSVGMPILDLLVPVGDAPPSPGGRQMCRHPFLETKRAIVVPSGVVPLHTLVWDGHLVSCLPTLEETRTFVKSEIGSLREDHIRFLNPTPYKVSVTQSLYESLHNLWFSEAPLEEIK
eukprot:TRINITY_DN11774_c0_g1_i1.p1 TRINITY_DN11774_c0_g1~~TRINITY_DN11774_c0_g1_i1.p1  ORF type:complete len:551 (-),score=47.92 TRINITY_DN11774_c0_g1_i1:9-1547(-)